MAQLEGNPLEVGLAQVVLMFYVGIQAGKGILFLFNLPK
jgi:hypothetical protein